MKSLNICNIFMYKSKRKNAEISDIIKKGLNSWIELYNNDCFKTKKEKNRMNYYINKLNEFERLLNDWSINNYTCIYITSCVSI